MFWRPKTAEAPLFGGRPLAIVRSTRARRMRLSIDRRSGAPKLTLPPRIAVTAGLAWAEGQREWIEAQLAAQPHASRIAPGQRIDAAGRSLLIDFNPAWPRTPRIDGDRLCIGGPREQLFPRLMRWLKAEAKRILTEETRHYAALAGVTVAGIGVGDPVSRWGSCSSSGAIRYSWRLILAPSFVRQATVAHEVAHRVHMNHGPAFHALVAELYGRDPAPARRWLRENGAALQAFGRDG